MNESSLSAKGAEEILTPAPETGAEAPDAAAEAAVEMEMSDAIVEEQEDTERSHRPATAEEVIASACDILAREAADIAGDDVRRLRAQWNTLKPAPALDENGEPTAEAVAEATRQEEMFAAILTQIRDKKAAWAAEQEAARAANLARKNAIIDE
ncbi:MAG: hypothetical protein K2F77_04065, partial [Muribaculaceae bacterium]|nr:hypothetical protein [Muribaculaceae bacterium]